MSSGDGTGASGIVGELSEQQRQERDALRLAAIVESSDDAIIGKDLNGTILTWNKGAERIFGFTAAEAIGKPILIIIPEERHPEEAEVLSKIRSGRAVEHFETVRRHKHGELLDISLTTSPIRDSSGKIIGASKIARDITEQKRLRRSLEEANRAKDEFLATLSHELRTPLNTVLGYTAMLREKVLTDEQRAKALDVISRNADALTKLVNDVLDTSRIITGRLRLQLQPCDLTVIASDAIDAVTPALQAKSLVLTPNLSPVLTVQGDPDRLRQIFWNLLANAVKFTPIGGRISVTVEQVDNFVRVAVEDTGVGIPREALELVFRRFWQADATQTHSHGGLGLGLALARHFVELHGGEITVKSDGPGKGSLFEILLPAPSRPGAH